MPKTRGRPFDATREQAIFQAVIDGLAEVGYDRLTVDMVAARAHAGKGALYRRWASKDEMVIEAVSAWSENLEVPDTGCLRGDLEALLETMHKASIPSDPRTATVVCGLMSAAARDDRLAKVMRERFVAPRRELLRTVVRRAVGRGEIPGGRDVELVTEVVPAFLFTRAVLYGETVTPELLRAVITRVVYPLLLAPENAQWKTVPS